MKKSTAKRVAKASRLPMPGEGDPRVTECVNLHRARVGAGLVPAGMPSASSRFPDDMTGSIATVDHERVGRIVFYISEGALMAAYADSALAPAFVAEIEGDVRCAVVTSYGRLTLMTSAGPMIVNIDDEGVCRATPPADAYPALRFEAVSEMPLRLGVEPRRLSSGYNAHSTSLSPADKATLSRDLCNAYEYLNYVALGAGYLLQPIWVRYRLLGHDGETLYVSNPTSVSASDGFQCLTELTAELGNDFAERGRMQLGGNVYRLRMKSLQLPDEAVSRAVERLVVEMSMPIHPLNSSTVSNNVIDRPSTSGPRLRCYLPGASLMMSPSPITARERMALCGAHPDEALTAKVVINNPFTAGEYIDLTIDTTTAFPTSAATQIRLVEALRNLRPADPGDRSEMCRMPHTVSAGAGALAGEHVVWGNICVDLWHGWKPEQLAAKRGSGEAWRGTVEIRLADGTILSQYSEGSSGAPMSLPGAISYPAGIAESVTMSIERGGRLYRRTVALTPSTDGNFALAVSPRGMPYPLDEVEGSLAYIPGGSYEMDFRNLLLAAPSCDPINHSHCASPVDSGIVEIAAVNSRGGSWEFARRRIYLFTNGGIFLTNLSDDGHAASTHRCDTRGIASREGVTVTGDERYPVVCIAGGDLVGLNRGQVVTLERGIAEQSVAWDCVDAELWLADHAGRLRVKQRVDGAWYHLRGVTCNKLATTSKGIVGITPEMVFDTSLPRRYSFAPASYRLLVPVEPAIRATLLEIDLRSEGISCAVAVGAESSCAATAEGINIGRYSLSGAVRAPLRLPVDGFSTDCVAVEISAHCAAATEIRSISVVGIADA